MGLVYILICLALITHTERISVVTNLIGSLRIFHFSCLQYSPLNLESVESLQALVCGKNFSSGNQPQLLIASGLIHLFVVSGSHLNFLKKIFDKILTTLCSEKVCNLFYVQIFILIALFFYCAICEFNPPIFRSFISLAIIFATQSAGFRWRTENLILVSGLCCLILSPEWVNSLSLQMSWIAALTLIVVFKFFRTTTVLFKNSVFYVQYLTTFNFLGIPSFASVGISTILTPFLEYVLFPLAIVVYILPKFAFIFDFCMRVLNFILSHLELNVFYRSFDSEKVIYLNWLLILGLHLFFVLSAKVFPQAKDYNEYYF